MPPETTESTPTTTTPAAAPSASAAPAVTPTPAADQAAANAVAQAAATTPAAGTVIPPVTPPAEVVYTLALPKDAVIEASAVERLTTFAKDQKLSPEAAQKALELANAEVAADRAKQVEAQQGAFKKMAFEEWPAQLNADKDLGGEKLTATITDVKRAADKFLTPDEREILNTTGWGNHPMLVRMFARIGQAMANDKLVMGGAGGGTERDNSLEGRANRLYKNDGKGPSA